MGCCQSDCADDDTEMHWWFWRRKKSLGRMATQASDAVQAAWIEAVNAAIQDTMTETVMAAAKRGLKSAPFDVPELTDDLDQDQCLALQDKLMSMFGYKQDLTFHVCVHTPAADPKRPAGTAPPSPHIRLIIGWK